MRAPAGHDPAARGSVGLLHGTSRHGATATRVAFIELPTRQAEPWASVLIENVYKGLEPYGESGKIVQIAVVQEMEKSKFADVSRRAFGFQFPVVSCGATYAPKKVWGFATVERDGSAHFKVPAQVPIYFMALDEHGRAIQRMRSFTHLMPGEQQSCVGCHANRNYVTPNTSARPLAALRPAQELTPPEWGVCGFSYPHIVQPVLDQYCVECHNAKVAEGGVDLCGDRTDFFNVSYETLARQGNPGENPVHEMDPVIQRPGSQHPADYAHVLGFSGQQIGRHRAHADIRTKPANRGSKSIRSASDACSPGST